MAVAFGTLVFGLAIASFTPAMAVNSHVEPKPGQGPAAPTLRNGSPREAGFVPRYIDELLPDAYQGTRTQKYGRPAYSGAAVLAARNGVIASSVATGFALRYANPTTQLPREQWIPAKPSTIWDLASVTKTFTGTLAIQQLAKGTISLNDRVTKYIPAFGQAGKGDITIRMLLTHTSGLAPDPTPQLWEPVYTTIAQRWAAVYATVPVAPPATKYIYSDINYMVMGRVIEVVTGKKLDVVVREGITGPLGMHDTMYKPPPHLKKRTAATDYEEPPVLPARGMVWGEVDDENAYALGGVSGHAGLFSTTRDLAIFSQMILNRGAYGGVRIVPKRWAKGFFRNYNKAFPGNGHSLMMEVNQYPNYFGAMDTPRTIGFAGFTGTSVVIDPTTDSFAILLTNRVHPTYLWTPPPTPSPQRRAIADDVARAVAVTPLSGTFSWFSGMENNPENDLPSTTAATLTVPVRTSVGTTRVKFNLWYRLIPPQSGPPAEQAQLEWSADSGQTWTSLPFTVRKNKQNIQYPDGTFTGLNNPGWGRASATIPSPAAGQSSRILIRWRYTNAALWQGRGLYVNHVVVTSGDRTLFDDARPRAAARVMTQGGFRRSAN